MPFQHLEHDAVSFNLREEFFLLRMGVSETQGGSSPTFRGLEKLLLLSYTINAYIKQKDLAGKFSHKRILQEREEREGLFSMIQQYSCEN